MSYLEIARVLIEHGCQAADDLRELWTRIVFNMLVSNTDDHLRNHGFILVPGKGWRLSEAYDMNPVPDANGLKLNVGPADNALDLELARSVAGTFRVPAKQADEIIGSPELAGRLKAGGTQLLTRHVVREATGRDHVEAALVSTVDTEGRAFGPERSLACDGIVLAVGATPPVAIEAPTDSRLSIPD